MVGLLHGEVMNPENFDETLRFIPTCFDIDDRSKIRMSLDLEILARQMEADARIAILTRFLRLRLNPDYKDWILYDLMKVLGGDLAAKHVGQVLEVISRYKTDTNRIADDKFKSLCSYMMYLIVMWFVSKKYFGI